MYFKFKNQNNQESSIELPIQENEFNKIKSKVKGQNLEDLDYWEFWNIRDYLFQKLIINNFENSLLSFLQNIHLNKFTTENEADKIEIKVVDIFYHFYSEEIYIFSEPSSSIYPNYKANRLEISLKYNVDELDFLLEKILNAFAVDYSFWTEEGESLSLDELELGDLFGNLMFKCWANIKSKLQSNVIGILSYASGGSGCLDLDNGNEIEETNEGIKSYIKTKHKDL